MRLVSPEGEPEKRSERLLRSIPTAAWLVGPASLFAPQGLFGWRWIESERSNDPTQGPGVIAGICVSEWWTLLFVQMASNVGDARSTRQWRTGLGGTLPLL